MIRSILLEQMEGLPEVGSQLYSSYYKEGPMYKVANYGQDSVYLSSLKPDDEEEVKDMNLASFKKMLQQGVYYIK